MAADGEDDSNKYRLQVSFVKALPGGDESDLILVSCAGSGLAEEERDKVVPMKRLSESIVRNSGLGYTIVRPGQLFEEPGGAKALVFDQGGRITQGISVADVADVCLKSLHDAAARNKSFDVCYECAQSPYCFLWWSGGADLRCCQVHTGGWEHV